VKHFNKLIGCVAVGLVSSAGAFADDAFYIDTGTDFSGDGSSQTGLKTSLLDHYWSTTVFTDANGDGVYSPGDTSVGSGGLFNLALGGIGFSTVKENQITGLTPGGDNNAYNVDLAVPSWILSFGWNDLVGTVNAFGGISYTSGTIYIKYAEATGNTLNDLVLADFSDILTLEVTSGGGNAIGQSLNLFGDITYASATPPAFYWEDGSVFEALGVSFSSNQNTEPYFLNGVESTGPIVIGTNIYTQGDGTGRLQGEHDGSISFHRVPVPGTLALFGLGLLGLARVQRRRKN